MQNGFVESFNGRLRDECLNEISVPQLPTRPGHYRNWKIDYNLDRPHTSLDGRTPHEFANQSSKDHTVNRAYL